MKWDADTYKEKFSFVSSYGESVLDWVRRPEENKVSRAVDLGCGQGELSEKLYQMGYEVIGIDSSISQLQQARSNVSGVEFKLMDMTDYELDESVDVVFSNAAFHWLNEEENKKMLKSSYSALKPGGQFVFEMGGWRNNQLVRSALENEFTKLGFIYDNGFSFLKYPTTLNYSMKHAF